MHRKDGPKTMIQPKISEVKKQFICSGFMIHVNMKNVYRNINKVLNEYKAFCGKNQNPNMKRPWQYISLSTNYDEKMEWDYFTGHVVSKYDNEPAGLMHFEIPKGDYAVFEIRVKHAFAFAFTMGRLKKYIYKNWLPDSGYVFSGYEFEYNDENMKKINPYNVDLYVGIKKK